MRHAVIAATLGSVSIVSLVLACSSSRSEQAPNADAGPDAFDTPDAADGAAALPYPLDQVCPASTDPSLEKCAKCSRESCCDTRTRSLTDAGDALIACLQAPACDTAACQDGCFNASPAQTGPFLEQYACLAHRCAVPCSGIQPTPCSTCTEQKCLRESVACDLSKDCFVSTTCIAACNKADTCIKDCQTRYPGARVPTAALLACVTNLCSAECS